MNNMMGNALQVYVNMYDETKWIDGWAVGLVGDDTTYIVNSGVRNRMDIPHSMWSGSVHGYQKYRCKATEAWEGDDGAVLVNTIQKYTPHTFINFYAIHTGYSVDMWAGFLSPPVHWENIFTERWREWEREIEAKTKGSNEKKRKE